MKFRKLLSCALALILIFSTLPVFTVSQAAKFKGGYFWKSDVKNYSKRIGEWKVLPDLDYDEEEGEAPRGYRIIGYYGKDKTVEIPSKLNGVKIYELSGGVFEGKNITSVYIPKSISEISPGTFHNCKKLTKVTFESGSKLQDIQGAFSNCTALKTITLPDSLDGLHYGAFEGCTSLTTVKAKSLTYIGSDVFKNCKKLKNIDLSKVGTIIKNAFSGCKSLEKANLENIRYIHEYAFANCTKLKTVKLSKNTKTIKYGMFKGCSSLEKISVPKENTKFAVYDGALSLKNKTEIIAYPAARADKNYKIPSETKKVRYYAFYGAKNVKANLTFSDKIKSIGDYAFSGCVLVDKISVPDTIEYLGKKAFRNTAFMKAQKKNSAYYVDNILIRMSDVQGQYTLKDGTAFIASHALDDCKVETLIIPEFVTRFNKNALTGTGTVDTLIINSNVDTLSDIGLEKVYSNKKAKNPVESTIKNVVVNSPVTSIGRTFSETSIESITLPQSLTAIDNHAFYNCKNMTECELGEQVTSLGTACFAQTQISQFTLTNKLTKIPDACFSGSSLEKIEIPESIKSIGKHAFYGTNLTEIVIPDTVTSIGHDIFNGCKNLKSVTLSKNITKIPSYAFYNCTSLKNLEIGENITSIKNKAFKNSGIISMEIPDTVTELGTNIFTGCKSLKYVKLPQNDTLNYISAGMFSYSSIKELEIPHTYIAIRTRAFRSSKIENLVLPESITDIRPYAFLNCKNLKAINLPKSLTSLDAKSVFKGSAIEKITVSSGIKKINAEMFKDCKNLKTVVLPDTVTSIEREAFYGCTNLSKINLGNSLRQIGHRAFYNCKSLKRITLPDSLEEFGEGYTSTEIFAYSGLEKITLPKEVTEINVRMFKGCKNLTKVTFKGYVEDMHHGTFTDCKKLETVVFEKGTKDISQAFNNCTALKKIYIKKGTVKNINAKAFKGAKSGIKFYVNTKSQAKTLKGALEKTNIKSAKIYANNVLVYKNVG